MPAKGEKGNETWKGDSWKHGGGANWMTGSYDPELNLVYWGTGNAASDFYAGDRVIDPTRVERDVNLYTASIVALDAAPGKLNLCLHLGPVRHDGYHELLSLFDSVSLADVLLEAVDFCSIGTNDLIQYTLAVDRNNPEVAQFYDPFHPSVLRAIAHVAEVARRLGKKVGICGEMAADPLFLPFFLAIGIDNLSISPTRVSELKSILLKRQYTPMVTEAVLGCRSSREIKDLLNRHRLL